MARSSADNHAKTLCQIAQTIVDGEIEAEKLWLHSLIVEIKDMGGAAYPSNVVCGSNRTHNAIFRYFLLQDLSFSKPSLR